MGDLSKHFSAREFACHCGCGYGTHPGDVSPALIDGLEFLRELAGGRPMTIVSGCRCRAHNDACGGARSSQHLLGTAADVKVAGVSVEALRQLALKVPVFAAGGIGIYDGWVHVDVRRHAARWDERRA